MLKKFINITTNSFKRQNMTIMARKLLIRLKERSANSNVDTATQWAAKQAECLEDYLAQIDSSLWTETQSTCEKIKTNAQKKLDKLGLDLGGGGNYLLLYFLSRHLKPEIVVETGVAAGWSSQAILTALSKNEKGTLYSSDFPYFRYENPEKYVGYIVDENLKKNWNLYIDGDENNLPKIIKSLSQKIGLFHYDSDKSITGRNFAYQIIQPILDNNAIVIFDDIQDNMHFKNFVESHQCPYKIFKFENKYIGLTGPYFDEGKKA